MGAEDWVIKVAREALLDELESARIYGALAERLKGRDIGRKLREIAGMEAEHAAFWARFLRARGVDPSGMRPREWRVRLHTALFHIIGFGLTIKLLELGESEAIAMYSRLLERGGLSEEEAEGLRKLIEDELMHEEAFLEEESKIREFLDHVRDAVLGMSDGLVEILSVTAGLAGAYGNPVNVALGGLIVGMAGALSMGIGSYISVKSQKEVRLGTLSTVREIIRSVPSAVARMLRKALRGKGLSEDTAEVLLRDATKDESLMRRLVAEEMYELKEEMIEDPGKAGLYTGSFYILGAVVPLIPYFLSLPVGLSLPLSVGLAGAMLAVVGFIIAVSAGLNIKRKVIEMVAGGIGAAAITYLIGKAASLLLGIEVG